MANERDERITIRCTALEKADVEARAQRARLTTSDYLRRCAIEQVIVERAATPIDAESADALRGIRAELRTARGEIGRLGGLQKSFFSGDNTALPQIFNAVEGDVDELHHRMLRLCDVIDESTRRVITALEGRVPEVAETNSAT